MGYISTVDNGTTIVVTTTSEVITFTIATENAVLKESTPLRVVIKDDVCWWYIYDLRMVFYQHTAGTPGSGVALTNDHSIDSVSDDFSTDPLATRWYEIVGTFTWNSGTGELEHGGEEYGVYDTELSTITQYAKITLQTSAAYSGIVLRSTRTASDG